MIFLSFIEMSPRMLRVSMNKDKNVHKFALSAISGDFLERESEKVRDIVLGYYTWVTYYP